VAEAFLTFAKPIVFDRGQTTSPFDWDVWSMAPDGTGQVNHTNDPSVLARNPTISPLGTKIAFERQSGSSDFDIWVMNIGGSAR
jgi:Tol biopolymer transport system component